MQTELNSFLIEITALIFGKKDDQGGDDFLLDKVLDKTGMKGTGADAIHLISRYVWYGQLVLW